MDEEEKIRVHAANYIDKFLELSNRSAREEYTDSGELWDLLRDTVCLLMRMLSNPAEGKTPLILNELDGSEFLLEAAIKVYGRETIFSKEDPIGWLEQHFEGTYESVGMWALENKSDHTLKDVEMWIDWEGYGAVLARDMGLTWVKGGEGIYLFYKEGKAPG